MVEKPDLIMYSFIVYFCVNIIINIVVNGVDTKCYSFICGMTDRFLKIFSMSKSRDIGNSFDLKKDVLQTNKKCIIQNNTKYTKTTLGCLPYILKECGLDTYG